MEVSSWYCGDRKVEGVQGFDGKVYAEGALGDVLACKEGMICFHWIASDEPLRLCMRGEWKDIP